MALELVGAVELLELEVEVEGFDLLDDDALRLAVDREPVDPPGDPDLPSPALEVEGDADLRLVVRVGAGPIGGAAGVDVLPEPHPAEGFPPIRPDPAVERVGDQVADRAGDLAIIPIDAHRGPV